VGKWWKFPVVGERVTAGQDDLDGAAAPSEDAF
jgi:hypothetical protein